MSFTGTAPSLAYSVTLLGDADADDADITRAALNDILTYLNGNIEVAALVRGKSLFAIPAWRHGAVTAEDYVGFHFNFSGADLTIIAAMAMIADANAGNTTMNWQVTDDNALLPATTWSDVMTSDIVLDTDEEMQVSQVFDNDTIPDGYSVRCRVSAVTTAPQTLHSLLLVTVDHQEP